MTEAEKEKQPLETENVREKNRLYTIKLYEKVRQRPFTDVGKIEEIMLPMSDGIRLRTICYIPQGITSGPVVIQRTCYSQMEDILEVHAREFCKRGFIFVIQWCRSSNGSEGKWIPNINERQDGLDTLNWLCEQPFTDCVGYWGNSYLAFTGWCMADAVPDKVKTMYLGVYGCDRHVSAYKDGLFRQDILTSWARDNAGVPIEADHLESCMYRPQIEVDEALWGVRLEWYRDWISNTDRTSNYWSQGLWKELKEIPGKMKIPVFIREGWYDHHLGSAIVTYADLSEESRKHSVFQIGPWNHGYSPAVTGQPLENLGDDSVQSPLDWFEQLLIKKEMPEKVVYTYCIGADKWEKWNQFSVPAAGKKIIYLDAEQENSKGKTLTKECAPGQSNVSFIYDPQNPVISHGAESLFSSQSGVGSLIQPECGYREDVVSFISGTIVDPVEIGGKIRVKLYVSSDVQDTAFSAKLMEIFEDGTTVNIRGTITTLAYRNGRTERGDYTPGEIVEINLEMWDISWMLKKGSKLRLDISSSDFPQYSIHSNFPGNWAMQKETQKAVQTIYTGEDYPSAIEIPYINA